MKVDIAVNPHFENYLFDWYYDTYCLVGSYGTSKSYHTALKIILCLIKERRKALVVREVYDTHRESTYSLFCEILEKLEFLADKRSERKRKAVANSSPFLISFPNGSKIIFRGMDKPHKLRSINDVTIAWLEEAPEIKYSGFKELKGRLRHPTLSTHIILTFNAVGIETWTYQHFFKRTDEQGQTTVILDDEILYLKKIMVKNGVYYHHSVPEDNFYLSKNYIKTLDEMKDYDPDLYRIARHGKFGVNGLRVLPQFRVAKTHSEVMEVVQGIPNRFRFNGMDFGFEESYNAVVRLAVNDKKKILYIYEEYYKNKMTDDKTALELENLGYNKIPIVADCAEPKAIAYYQQQGFKMRKSKKTERLNQVRKIKRFKKIVCSPECSNCIRELSTLVYKKDTKDKLIYDEFNIDPHTFSAIWYALDIYHVADVKEQLKNSR